MRLTTADDPDIDYLQRARDFVPELTAAAPQIERQRELPEAVLAAMVERGFFRMLLPRSLGGAELLPARYVPIVEEIAKADASAAWCLTRCWLVPSHSPLGRLAPLACYHSDL